MSAKKICIVVSDPITVRAFLSDQIKILSKELQVTVVMNAAADEEWRRTYPTVTFEQIAILRTISIADDLKALWSLYRYFLKNGFDIVHSVTPKAGLLSMLAALLASIPNRLHTFTGQVWATRSGISRFFFKSLDKLIVKMATGILIDSFSQRDFLTSEGVLKQGQGTVLGQGSISGVDVEKFKEAPEVRCRVRNKLGIGKDSLVFLFLGRLNHDKGILDLAEAYRLYRHAGGTGHLLLVGPDEINMEPKVRRRVGQFQDQLHFVGWTSTPQNYMAAADVFCLPSYREGFGSVIIEAASCGLPAIGSRIYGIVDAIVAGETGLLHDPRNPKQLCESMLCMAQDARLRNLMGKKGATRARMQFAKEILSSALLDFYRRILTSPFGQSI